MTKGFVAVVMSLLLLMNVLLLIELSSSEPDNTTYIPHQENDYVTINTKHGAFPISIVATNKIDDGTELGLILINPVNIHFADAEIFIQTAHAPTRITLDIRPGVNSLKAKVPSIERGELIKISLNVDKLYFK